MSSSSKSSKSSKEDHHEGFLEALFLSPRVSESSSGGIIMRRNGTKILYPGSRPRHREGAPPPKPASSATDAAGAQKSETTFTEEQDATIRHMKTKEKGKSWKDVGDAVGKSPDECKQRWKVINAAATDMEKEGNAERAADAAKTDGEGAKKDDKKKKGSANVKVPRADEHFSTADLETLAELIKQDRDLFWLRVASRFFDQTGKRLHPNDIEEKFS